MTDPGEELLGICVASQRKGLFQGGSVAIGVTGQRLLIQPLDRRGNPDGVPLTIEPTQVVSARARPAGGEWFNVYAGIMDHAAVELRIKTTNGDDLKLMMMRGEGSLLGKLGGGELQRRGVEALAEWFSDSHPA
jgi:hypothetical protein